MFKKIKDSQVITIIYALIEKNKMFFFCRCFGNRKVQSAEINILTPVFPMLAEACKSVEYAMKKCPNGMFSEIKYDGER